MSQVSCCPFGADDCPHPAGVNEVLHYMCRTCISPGCDIRVSAIGAAQCTPCIVAYLDTHYGKEKDG